MNIIKVWQIRKFGRKSIPSCLKDTTQHRVVSLGVFITWPDFLNITRNVMRKYNNYLHRRRRHNWNGIRYFILSTCMPDLERLDSKWLDSTCIDSTFGDSRTQLEAWWLKDSTRLDFWWLKDWTRLLVTRRLDSRYGDSTTRFDSRHGDSMTRGVWLESLWLNRLLENDSKI